MHTQLLRLYGSHITSARKAMLHLLLRCCHIDGECSENELRTIRRILQTIYGDDDENLLAALPTYRTYASHISHDGAYLQFLLHHIKPAHPVALLWYCAQVTVADRSVCYAEELLVSRLANLLQVEAEESKLILRLALRVQQTEESRKP